MLNETLVKLLQTQPIFKKEFDEFKSKIFFSEVSNTIDVRLLGILLINFISEYHPVLLSGYPPIAFNKNYIQNINSLVDKLMVKLEEKYTLELQYNDYINKEVCLIIHNEIGVFTINEVVSDKEFGFLFKLTNIHTEFEFIVPVDFVINNTLNYSIDGENIIIHKITYNTQYGAEVLGRKLNLSQPINFSLKINFINRDYRAHYKNILSILTAQVALTGEPLPNFETLNNLLIKYYF